MIKARINFNPNPGDRSKPSPSTAQSDPTNEDPTKVGPRKKRLLKQKERIEVKLERLDKKASLASKIREIASILQSKKAQKDLKVDSTELYNQISGTLDDFGLRNIIEKMKIAVFDEQNAKKEYLYKVPLRRNDELDPDTISKIDDENNRNKNFIKIIWTSKGMEAYIWGPYIPPETEAETGETALPEGTEP